MLLHIYFKSLLEPVSYTHLDVYKRQVTDRSWLKENQTLTDSVEKAILGGVTIVQLREKNTDFEEQLSLAQELKTVCKKYNVPLIINDSVELALKSGADGIHLGQSRCV